MGAICRELRRSGGDAGGGVATLGSSGVLVVLACGGKKTGVGTREGLARVVGVFVFITLGETEGICRGTAVGRIAMGVRAIVLVGGFVVS